MSDSEDASSSESSSLCTPTAASEDERLSASDSDSCAPEKPGKGRKVRHIVKQTSYTMTSAASLKPPKPRPKFKKQTPQEIIDEFWNKFSADQKTAGKPTTIIPQSHHVTKQARRNASLHHAKTCVSYAEAAAMCRAKVEKIILECRRVNQKYRDPHFDIEADLKLRYRDCLESLSNEEPLAKAPRLLHAPNPGAEYTPKAAKRVVDIFDDPRFFIDGPSSDDVRQGKDGDCWLMAALCTLSNVKGLGLIEKLCVAHDQDVGVYGFVFHRDGEWISEIIDDYLYLTKPDYDEGQKERVLLEDFERDNPEEAYRKIYQSNSNSLYFASCVDPQETWLPLLEKCFAKAHGDYAALEGGFSGEALEDLTGGVTTQQYTADILDKEKCWQQLRRVNQDFLFNCGTGLWPDGWGERKGIVEGHSYSVSKVVDVEGKRLMKLRNPWGRGEWKGPWSDGSKEWTAEWLQRLDHKFGDDGDFWIEYSDFLRKFQVFERTRLFDDEWQVTQVWTTLDVPPCVVDYQDTYFTLSIPKPGPVVIVLSQLDNRYFRGLEGQYRLELAFRIHKAGHEDYLIRTQTESHRRMIRSVNVDLDLDAGDYDVRVKVVARKDTYKQKPEQVIKNNASSRPDKLTRIGLAYDLAHRKGKFVETPEEKKTREAHEKQEKEKKRLEIRDKITTQREKAHYLKTKKAARNRRKEKKKLARAAVKGEGVAKSPQSGESQALGQGQQAQLAVRSKRANGDDGKSPEIIDLISPVTEPGPPLLKTEPSAGLTQELLSAVDASTKAPGDPAEPKQPSSTGSRDKEWEKVSPQSDDDDAKGTRDDVSDTSIESLSDLSDREMDLAIESYENAMPSTTEPSIAGNEEEAKLAKKAWNAVAVVGLRVYWKKAAEADATAVKDDEKQTASSETETKLALIAEQANSAAKGGATGDLGDAPDRVAIKVVRPNPVDAKEGIKEGDESKVLDIDDSARDATVVGTAAKKHKKSTSGSERRWRTRDQKARVPRQRFLS